MLQLLATRRDPARSGKVIESISDAYDFEILEDSTGVYAYHLCPLNTGLLIILCKLKVS